jgi:lysophospholipase L1-like esterase
MIRRISHCRISSELRTIAGLSSSFFCIGGRAAERILTSAMNQILVYGDSLTWGIIPETRKRLPFAERWPGVLEAELRKAGHDVRVIEDCLNGRRTVWEDPFKPGRNGLIGLEQRIEAHSPLALVILMLGTNDFQSMHQHTAFHSAQGIAALVRAIRQAPIEPGMPSPDILIVAPPPTQTPKGTMAAKFEGAREKSAGLADAYRSVAVELRCHFLDAAAVTATSRVDGVHLDADQHLRLGREVARVVIAVLATSAA